MPTKIRNIVGPIVHVAVCTHHIYAMFYSNKMNEAFVQMTDQRVVDMGMFAPIYFTSWNMIIQTIYFLLATLYDVLHIFSLNENLKEKTMLYKGYIFTSLVFPCSMFVSTMFWSVYSINREWVLPELFDEFIPEWLNHSVHTNIVVFLVIEVLIVNQLLPTFKSAFVGLSILSGIYHILFICVYFQSGKWIYGLFYVFSWPERILFMLSNYLFTVFIMKVGIKIQSFKHTLLARGSLRCKEN